MLLPHVRWGLYLRSAIIVEDVTIDATAIFGGIEIYLPDDVNVKLTSTALFGASDNGVKRVAGAHPITPDIARAWNDNKQCPPSPEKQADIPPVLADRIYQIDSNFWWGGNFVIKMADMRIIWLRKSSSTPPKTAVVLAPKNSSLGRHVSFPEKNAL